MADDRTLGEIKRSHFDELEQLLKSAKLETFISRKQAQIFHVTAFRNALELMGVPKKTVMEIQSIDCVLQIGNVRVEARRPEGPPEEVFWRTGIYIFKTKGDGDEEHDELAYFISNIKTKVIGPFDRDRSPKWSILTNAKVFVPRIISVPISRN